jgi:hypothetical protein
MVEDLIYSSLTNIEQPLNLIHETPAGNYYEPDNFESDEEGSNSDNSGSESEDMEDNNNNNGEGGNKPQENKPWLGRYDLEILERVHNLPRHPEKLLPKFDPETSRFPADHIKKFILAIRLMNVQHEDVVCMIFLYTFENSVSTWYFNLPVGSKTSWT